MNDLVLVFDPSIGTRNLGDAIIAEAVRRELGSLFPRSRFSSAPTHEVVSRHTYELAAQARLAFVGGTNLLSSNMNRYNQWQINLLDSLSLKNVVLMGVGWWQYQERPNAYTRLLLRRVLSRTRLHSVRDEYTRQKLLAAGLENVVNTGCPTTWGLSPAHCTAVPRTKADAALFTLTDYARHVEKDGELLRALRRSYGRLYFWPQGSEDLAYLGSLGAEGIEVIAPRLDALDGLLAGLQPLDYVGTRLHAGIRALQHRRRTIVIAVDNRAAEMGRDVNLPCIARQRQDGLEDLVNGDFETRIALRHEDIARWKAQFLAA